MPFQFIVLKTPCLGWMSCNLQPRPTVGHILYFAGKSCKCAASIFVICILVSFELSKLIGWICLSIPSAISCHISSEHVHFEAYCKMLMKLCRGLLSRPLEHEHPWHIAFWIHHFYICLFHHFERWSWNAELLFIRRCAEQCDRYEALRDCTIIRSPLRTPQRIVQPHLDFQLLTACGTPSTHLAGNFSRNRLRGLAWGQKEDFHTNIIKYPSRII